MAELPWQLFRFCPRCGTARADPAAREPAFGCDRCGLHYFFNPAIAVAALILRDDGRGLFIRRAKDPEKGKLALVGGFVDVGEPAEQALRREVREEVRLELGPLRFLSSNPNDYEYRGVIYPVVDVFFVAQAEEPGRAAALDGVASFSWEDPARVDLDSMAFASMRDALERFRSGGRER